jgi:hypothetical protein
MERIHVAPKNDQDTFLRKGHLTLISWPGERLLITQEETATKFSGGTL